MGFVELDGERGSEGMHMSLDSRPGGNPLDRLPVATHKSSCQSSQVSSIRPTSEAEMVTTSRSSAPCRFGRFNGSAMNSAAYPRSQRNREKPRTRLTPLASVDGLLRTHLS